MISELSAGRLRSADRCVSSDVRVDEPPPLLNAGEIFSGEGCSARPRPGRISRTRPDRTNDKHMIRSYRNNVDRGRQRKAKVARANIEA